MPVLSPANFDPSAKQSALEPTKISAGIVLHILLHSLQVFQHCACQIKMRSLIQIWTVKNFYHLVMSTQAKTG